MKEYFEVFEQPTSIKDMVYKNIKRQIIQGSFKPGTWLKELELADAMKISRAPIREAFNQLERDGFINIIPRKGVRVASLSVKEVEEVFEIRENLELLALKKSFNNLPIDHLNKLAKVFEQFKFKTTGKTNISQYLSLDKEFHDLFINYCDNGMLIKLLSNIQEKIHWLRGFSLNKQSFIESVEEHLAIIQAIQIQDKELTSKNLVRHLRRAKEAIIQEIRRGNIQ